MSFVRTVAAVLVKDLRLELRGRHALNLLLPFAAATLVVFGLSLGPGRAVLVPVAPAVLWVTVLFAALLGVRRSFEAEDEDGALDRLVLAPVDKGAIYAGKVLALSALLLLLAAVTGVMAALLFDLPLPADPPVVAAGFVLGTLGLSAVGCLFAGLVVSARAREALLPLLVLPVVVPLALGGIRATALGLSGETGDALSWLGLLAAFDAMFVASGILLFDKVLED